MSKFSNSLCDTVFVHVSLPLQFDWPMSMNAVKLKAALTDF